MSSPNILCIMTDQQSRHMMSCAGNPYVSTPAMDSLAAAGTRFTRAYCTNPVCVPSRFSLFTGRMPSEIGLKANGPVGVPEISPEIKRSALGWTLRDGGHRTLYAGKQHFPKMDAADLGFEVLTLDERDTLATAAADFVGRQQETPWFMAASFINPHDICYMALSEHMEGEPREPTRDMRMALHELDAVMARLDAMELGEGFADRLPPLPPNFEPQQDEPEALKKLVEKRAFRQWARDTWDEHRWRLHRWAYARLTERVDGQIQILLDALRSGPNRDNTVIIFTSDHGDHDASHRLEHKTMPYEEAAGIPLIICQPGARGGVVNGDLVSNGLDLFPTICDYVGIEAPAHLRGRSLRPLVEGSSWPDPRATVPVETEIGNALVSEHYKYLKCFEGEHAEQFYDLRRDPHETRSFTNAPELGEVLDQHRKHFENERL